MAPTREPAPVTNSVTESGVNAFARNRELALANEGKLAGQRPALDPFEDQAAETERQARIVQGQQPALDPFKDEPIKDEPTTVALASVQTEEPTIVLPPSVATLPTKATPTAKKNG